MISYKKALEIVEDINIRPRFEELELLESLGCVLARDILANEDIPAYDNSAMDGYALIHDDIKEASKDKPASLLLLEEDISAGKDIDLSVQKGACVSIMTGGRIPKGADAVVMQEDVKEVKGRVFFFKECTKGQNIRKKGEDIRKGTAVLLKGKRLSPPDIGVMASLGYGHITIYKRPLVGILSTGDELIELAEKLSAPNVRDSNSYSLAAQVMEMKAKFKRYGIVKDRKSLMEKTIAQSLEESDILLISGGISVGKYDYVKEILQHMGAELLFWQVRQKPGKPLAVFTYQEKVIFALPGNPVSSMVCFYVYVSKLIGRMMGLPNHHYKSINAKTKETLPHKKGRTEFIRVRLEKKDSMHYIVKTGPQGSGILTSLVEADGIALIDEEAQIVKKGTELEVILIKEGNTF